VDLSRISRLKVPISFNFPIPVLSVMWINFLSSVSFQPEVLYSTDLENFLNLG
jgi:hypothetical protein